MEVALDILLKSLEIEIPTKSFDLIAHSNLLKAYSDMGKKKETMETMNLLEKLSSDRSKLSISTGSIYYILGNSYFTYGDIEKSEEYLIRSLSLRYGRWYRFSAYVLLGQIELRHGKFQQAQNHFEKAGLLYPRSPVLLLHLGDVYYAQKDVKKAEEFYRSALKIKPRYFKAYIQLGQLYIAQKKYPSAKEALEKALEFKPNEYKLLVSLGNISFLQGNMDSSIMYFSRALEIRPENPTNYFNLGECYARKGDTANAKKYFLRFLELAHDDKFKAAKDKAVKWLKNNNSS
ncbi:MAG: tetratricopeptide repeat protein [Candidatus Mariimomonas ferrooxydans]